MIKLYFKQAWQLLKQNPLFSSVYVLGTGLGIAMTMSLVIIITSRWHRSTPKRTGTESW